MGDENTVWSNMPKLGLDRYIVFIANIIDTDDVTINCFLFQMKNLRVKPGKIQDLDGNSPLRLNENILQKICRGAESFNSINIWDKEREHIRNRSTREYRDNSLKQLNNRTFPVLKNSENKYRPEDHKLVPPQNYDLTSTQKGNQRRRDYRGKTLKETGYNAENFAEKNKQQRSLKDATLESPKPDNFSCKSENHSPRKTEAGLKEQCVLKVEFNGTDSSVMNVIVEQPNKQAGNFNRSSLKRKSGDYDNVRPTENEHPKCKASKPNEAYKVNDGEMNVPSKCNLEKIDERPSTPSGRINTEGIQEDQEGEKADCKEITENSWLSHFRIMCCRMKRLSINEPEVDEIRKSVENADKSG